MPKPNKKLMAVVEDLFFTVKINDAAKKAGMTVEFVKEEEAILEKAKEKPSLIIFDLNLGKIAPLKIISKLKSSEELKDISLIGFVSHVQGELKQKAQDSGCDMVMAKSAFSQNLPLILKRHAGTV
jgi:CheY-like chemotaxis protein